MNNSYNPWNTTGYNYPQYPYGMNQQVMNTMPTQQNTPRVNAIPGRVISNPNEIAPNEIPMDGSVSLFPTSDYSTIYAKAWNTNGQIETKKFVAVDSTEPASNQAATDTTAALTAINARLDKIEKAVTYKYKKDKHYYNNQNAQNKKEVTPNE